MVFFCSFTLQKIYSVIILAAASRCFQENQFSFLLLSDLSFKFEIWNFVVAETHNWSKKQFLCKQKKKPQIKRNTAGNKKLSAWPVGFWEEKKGPEEQSPPAGEGPWCPEPHSINQDIQTPARKWSSSEASLSGTSSDRIRSGFVWRII